MEETNTNLNEGAAETSAQTPPALTQAQIDDIKDKLRLEQNLPLGIGMSALIAVVGAILWGVITVATKYQIGYMAVAVGFLVGYGNRYFGKGIDPVFGIVGGVFALIGCVFGNYISLIGFASQEFGVSFSTALGVIPFGEAMSAVFSEIDGFDILFYGLALYEGYRFSFRQITEDDLKNHLVMEQPAQ